MRIMSAGLFLAFSCFMSAAQAEICSPQDTVLRGEVEDLNGKLVDGDYDGLGSSLSAASVEPAPIIELLKTNFPQGFDDCETLVHRADDGTVLQSVVAFSNSNTTLYVYIRSAYYGRRFVVLNFYLNTDHDPVFERVF
jgi:hypothetical protein